MVLLNKKNLKKAPPTQTNPPAKDPKIPSDDPTIPEIPQLPEKEEINCPIGNPQNILDWFNYKKWQRLNPDYSSSNFYLYIDKTNGTWKLQDETDSKNITILSCGIFENIVPLKDYAGSKMGYGTINIFYKDLNIENYWTCWYGYYYNEPNANPYVPKNESRIMLNCGESDDLFDTEISYYFRSFGF